MKLGAETASPVDQVWKYPPSMMLIISVSQRIPHGGTPSEHQIFHLNSLLYKPVTYGARRIRFQPKVFFTPTEVSRSNYQ